MVKAWITVSVCLLFTELAVAQAPPAVPTAGAVTLTRAPALSVALELAQVALAVCKAQGANINVSIVDAAGEAKVTLAADGGGGKPSTAVRKAATAIAFKSSGSEMEKREKTDAEFAAKIAANPALYNDHPGSLLLKVGTEIIGAIGVSGSATHEQGEACAQTALNKLQSKLK